MWTIKSPLRKYSLLLVILYVLTACNRLGLTSEKEAQFTELYPNILFGGYLELNVMQSNPDSRYPVDVFIENVSDQVILLPETDHGLYIFDEERNEWISVKEKMRYPNDDMTILYPEEDWDKLQYNSTGLPIYPDLVLQEQPITVRLVLIGEIVEIEQSTGRNVGAFIDITYKR